MKKNYYEIILEKIDDDNIAVNMPKIGKREEFIKHLAQKFNINEETFNFEFDNNIIEKINEIKNIYNIDIKYEKNKIENEEKIIIPMENDNLNIKISTNNKEIFYIWKESNDKNMYVFYWIDGDKYPL